MSGIMPTISRLQKNEKKIYMLRKADVGVQLPEDEAMYVARTLALLLGYNLIKRGTNRLLMQDEFYIKDEEKEHS